MYRLDGISHVAHNIHNEIAKELVIGSEVGKQFNIEKPGKDQNMLEDMEVEILPSMWPVVIGHQDKELRYRFIYNHFPSLQEENCVAGSLGGGNLEKSSRKIGYTQDQHHK